MKSADSVASAALSLMAGVAVARQAQGIVASYNPGNPRDQAAERQ